MDLYDEIYDDYLESLPPSPEELLYQKWVAENEDTIVQLDALVERLALIPFERTGHALSLADEIAEVLSFVPNGEIGDHVLLALLSKLEEKQGALKKRLTALQERVPGYLLRMATGLPLLSKVPGQAAERASEFRESKEGEMFMKTLQVRATNVYLESIAGDTDTANDFLDMFGHVLSSLLQLVRNEMIPGEHPEQARRMTFQERKGAFINTLRRQEGSTRLNQFAVMVSSLPIATLYYHETLRIVAQYMSATAGYNASVDPFKKIFRRRIGDKIAGSGQCQMCKSAPVQGKCTDCRQEMCKACYAAH